MKKLALAVTCCLLLLGSIALAEGVSSGEPGMNHYPAADADLPTQPRMYPGAPPVIAHGTEGIVLNLKTNECLDCHTPPQSHFTNPFTGVTTPDEVVGTRYYCNQCHVPQAVENPPYLKK